MAAHTPNPGAVAVTTPAIARPRRTRRLLGALALVLLLPFGFHYGVGAFARMTPPSLTLTQITLSRAKDDTRRKQLAGAYARKRGAITEVRLRGDPVSMGQAHVKLLYHEQLTIERELHQQFRHFVPWSAARTLIIDMARLRFRTIDQTLSPSHRLEIAAQAAAFAPDPFTSLMDTYPRFIYLHTLYDMLLSFEHSPLIGCTSLVVGPGLAGGHTLLARNFDFEGPQVLDDHKVVFLIFEQGRIPYASVSWPGFVGAATGMNREGLAIVIHGARAGQLRAHGKPVAQTVRELLGGARRTRQAITMLQARAPMVPHMLLIADALGDAVVVERVPGRAMFVREMKGQTLPLTNHLEGPDANDPKNLAVRANSSTLARRARLDEIISNLRAPVSVKDAVAILRDKTGRRGKTLPLGDRRAIDALIATHSVVMDNTARALWVSEGPHVSGRFVRFNLRQLLDPAYRPRGPAHVEVLPADDIASDGRYDAWAKAGAQHPESP